MEKIIKRPDGSKVKIVTRVHAGQAYWIKYATYTFEVWNCAPRKRKYVRVAEYNDSEARRQQTDKLRRENVLQRNLQYVTKEEVHQAFLELWESIKPDISDVEKL